MMIKMESITKSWKLGKPQRTALTVPGRLLLGMYTCHSGPRRNPNLAAQNTESQFTLFPVDNIVYYLIWI